MDENENDADWLDGALEPLRSFPPPRSQAWPFFGDIGRRAILRRRRRRIGLAVTSTVAIPAVALLVALVAVPGTGPRTSEPPPVVPGAGVSSMARPGGSVQLLVPAGKAGAAGSKAAAELASAEQSFALDLTREELFHSAHANVLLSPTSVDVDLSMLELGAGGQTEHEIATALRSAGLSADENAAAWKLLVSSELAHESSGELTLANSLWIDQRLHVEPAFLQAASGAFGDDTYQVDFDSLSATNAINAWVDHATAGRISELFAPGELLPTTDVVLANALHLHAAWANGNQFAATTGSFVTGGGKRVSVPTLTATDDQLDFAATPSYQAVQIPYTNGRFRALVIQPRSGSLADWLAGLSPKTLAAIVGSLAGGTVDLSMPRLDLSSRPLLNSALSAMGMADAFFSADLMPMLGPSLGNRVAVAQVQQADTLQVDRFGTDAAASTGISVVPTSTRAIHVVDIDIDRPYLFLVRDTKTGVILFSSVVNDPAVS
jgi:serpin B